VQWDLRNTYFPPNHLEGRHESLLPRKDSPFRISGQEFRRRRILTAALKACEAFQVEGLVLPEYSVRLETINWLSHQMKERRYPKAIWAGTFLAPSGQSVFVDYERGLLSWNGSGTPEFLDFSAVAACLWKVPENLHGYEHKNMVKGDVQISARRKRYPSVAMEEIIRPDTGTPWRPLFDSIFWGQKHLQTYTAELVCAEIFLHASSGNMPGAIAATEELLRQLGMPRSTDLKDYMLGEVLDFARYTAFQEGKDDLSRSGAPQRTILIVPAMTSRSADFHIFGQNHYLASGLVTVFANPAASSGNPSVGGSCFIGLDGWKKSETLQTPYGGIGPGLFNIGSDNFGSLKPRESAMVIADIDPLRPANQKPRPHFQARPLQLVAHLPLIYSSERSSVSKENLEFDRAIRERSVNSSEPVETFQAAMARTWPEPHAMSELTAHTNNTVEETLKLLELFSDEGTWLKKRRESLLIPNSSSPQRQTPPPALVDWLYVDDSWPKNAQFVQDDMIDDEPPSLFDASSTNASDVE